ncbi:hypothetical protein B8024_22035 [Klebsiella pneumoniae]|nr:hypothetical protein B8Z99_16970 [Klebsiella pneumoniae]OVI49257.1 hypothetical protein B8024_22035 [Klebsiella pneumoniae]
MRVWRRLLENSLSAKVSCWLIRLLILGSGYNTMISHLGLIRTFLNECPDNGEGGSNQSMISQIISKYGKVRL